MSASRSSRLADALVKRHGEILKGAALRKSLGFRSPRTLYRAVANKSVPVPLFKMSGQSAWSAKTRDVAAWLSSLGSNPSQTTVKEETKEAK